VDKDIINEIVRTLGQKYGSEFRTSDQTQFELGVSGGVGVGTGGGKNQGGSFWLLQIGGGGSVGFNWNYTDQQVRAMSVYLSRDEKNALVDKFIESLQNKSGQRSSDSQAKRVEQAYTQGKDVSEEASKSKVYEVAESFGKKAGEMLAYAERLQASLRQDPLNYYVQQKYKEALAAGKSEGEAVRYAMQELAKLRSNPEALEKWLNEFAKGQGIRSPNVDEKKLEGVQNEVPKPENIQQKGQELTKDVEKKIGDTQKQIEQRQSELKHYSPPQAKLFNLQVPKLELKFDPNDPKFKAFENRAREWFINQPNPLQRPFIDAGDTVVRIPEVGKRYVKNFLNSPKQPVGDRLNTPPLLGVP
jgi:cytochrome c556